MHPVGFLANQQLLKIVCFVFVFSNLLNIAYLYFVIMLHVHCIYFETRGKPNAVFHKLLHVHVFLSQNCLIFSRLHFIH